LSMLRKSVCASRRRGRLLKKIKQRTEVKKRHMNTGTVAAMDPKRMRSITMSEIFILIS
jgi:hypothetical protein